MTAILIDTNVLVYAFDRQDFAKQAQAVAILAALQSGRQGFLSVQTLAEFFSATTRGKMPKLTPEAAYQHAEQLTRTFSVLDLTPLIVLEATRGVRVHKLAYWDAQLWATARLNQIAVIFSEDFNTGAVLEGVRFVNPFSADFVLEAWA